MVVKNIKSPHSPLKTLAQDAISLQDGLWKNKQDLNNRDSIRHGYNMLDQVGNFHNLRLAAGLIDGEFMGLRFVDSDLYKWLQGACYAYATTRDAAIKTMIDDTIDLITAAQREDGYINTYYQIVKPDEQWQDLDHGHELYCAGHLMEAAVAHHRVTGEGKLLAAAEKFAEHIDKRFGEGKTYGIPGHPEIELALVELYRETGKEKYLKLSQYFVDARGRNTMRGLGPYGAEYHQDSTPVRDAKTLVGHAVRALYLITGAMDVYMETGDEALFNAAQHQWRDFTQHKMYLTGGAGARHTGEAFGAPYELPPDQAYCETCAAIASIFWNWRMLLVTGEGKYADLIERTLYNGFLSGLSLDGCNFFYVNPLNATGKHERQPWYACACCPPNVMRLLASIHHYVATYNSTGTQIHQYMPAAIHSGDLSLEVKTTYPWDASVTVKVTQAPEAVHTISLRIPEWCQTANLRVNGDPQETDTKDGYIHLNRKWQNGDIIELVLYMMPVYMEGHPLIEAVEGSMALMNGPLVYCIEQCDVAVDLDLVALDPKHRVKSTWSDIFAARILETEGYAARIDDWRKHLYRPVGQQHIYEQIKLTFIPYFLWANREPGKMRVWLPRRN